MLLQGKAVVVTGGNSGIGEAIVLAAAAEGANVVIDYVAHPEETTELIAKVEAAGGHAVGVQADVSKSADLHTMVQTAVDTYGRLDVLINNAGIETRTSLLDTTEADFDKVMAINMKSAFFGTQAAAKQFISPGRRRAGPEHLLRPRGLADAGQHRLLRVQGRYPDAHPHRRRRTRRPRHPRRQHRSRRGVHPDQRLHRGRPGQDEIPGRSDPARPDGAAPPRSPTWWCSWPPARPAT